MKKRIQTIDALKGFLIIAVIIGHLFNTGVADNQWKWLIYGWHMPLFFGVSGYLCNLQRLRQKKTPTLLRYYGERLLIAWFFAFLLYTTIVVHPNSVKALIRTLLYPWYHLWFIPVYFLYIVIARYLRLNESVLLTASGFISLASLSYFGLGSYSGARQELDFIPEFVKVIMGDKRIYTMALFFFFGIWVKSKEKVLLKLSAVKLASILAISTIVLWTYLFSSPRGIYLIPTYLLLNTSLILLLPHAFTNNYVFIGILNRIGQNTLFYYLWHPFLFLIAKKHIYPICEETMSYVLTFFGSMILLYCTDRLLSPTVIAPYVGLISAPNQRVEPIGTTPVSSCHSFNPRVSSSVTLGAGGEV